MKILTYCFIGFSLLAVRGQAQITNLIVNSVSTPFTMASGDAISWQYNIPSGATAAGELWLDVNQNGVIDPSTDKERFIFTQTDGDPNGIGGPPDMDGLVNGQCTFSQSIGLAPGKYILKFTNNSTSVTRSGTLTPLVSPVHLISGTVTPPAGKSAQNIFIQIRRQGNFNPDSWEALTDGSGNYTIQMNGDTAGNPWQLRMADGYSPYPPYVVAPDMISLTITGNHSGNNFSFLAPAAQIAGTVKDELGGALGGVNISLRNNDTTNFYRSVVSDGSGFFQIGLLSSEIHGQTWTINTETQGGNNGSTTTQLLGFSSISTILSGDSLYRRLVIYNVNSQIKGKVLVNGHPSGYPIMMNATAPDTAQSITYSDSLTGNFTFLVSDKIHSYDLYLSSSYYGPGTIVTTPRAHAGDSNVVVNIYTQTFAFVQESAGWNIVSVPLAVSDSNLSSIFPTASPPAFSYATAGGYALRTILHPGVGYWLKCTNSNSQYVYGTYFAEESLNVSTGWNLIGIVSDSVKISSIVPIGTTTISSYFGYSPGTGYTEAFTLQPGFGYWIKVSQNGTLFLRSGTGASALKTARDEGKIDDNGFNRLVIRDARGMERTLLLSSRTSLDLQRFEAPPMAPSGEMDVRFSSNRFLEAPDQGREKTIPLLLSSASYPLTIHWTMIESGRSSMLMVDGKEIEMKGKGELTIQRPEALIQVKIFPQDAGEVPVRFGLDQNYPNPFNPSTNVSFVIGHSTLVTLKVYDVLGREVATLINEAKQPGTYNATWDAGKMPSGVYFYRLTAGSYSSTRKMILMK